MIDFFARQKPIVGMVHLLPLQGSPAFRGDLPAIYERALREARYLQEAGLDAIIVENFGDEPYRIGEPDPADFALMAGIVRDLVREVSIPVGVNVQFNAWRAEMAIAQACGAAFVRIEVFVDTVISPQGIVLPCSADLLRYRRQLGAKVQIWADVQTKYTTNLVAQPLTQSAMDAQDAGADALIVTGAGTGKATPLEAIAEVKRAVSLPVLAGSGTTTGNVRNVLELADGIIVGSALKEGGVASNPVSPEAAQSFMGTVRQVRQAQSKARKD